MSLKLELEHLPIAVSADAVTAFCRARKVRELAVFGSILREDFGSESDVDVLVTFEEGAPWSLWDWPSMRDELAAIFGRNVDLVEKDAIRNPFRRRAILREHRVIYGT